MRYFATMKKLFLILAAGTLFLAAGCSGKGAYSEDEKKAQDSVDDVRQEDGFDALEKMANDSGTVAGDSNAKKQ